MTERFIVAIAYIAVWLTFGWGTFAVVMLKRRRAAQKKHLSDVEDARSEIAMYNEAVQRLVMKRYPSRRDYRFFLRGPAEPERAIQLRLSDIPQPVEERRARVRQIVASIYHS